MIVVAIDGPAGSGKSTLARVLAERLGLDVLETGSMYRAVTARALELGVDPRDQEALRAAVLDARIELVESVPSGAQRAAATTSVLVDGFDTTDWLRTEQVNAAVSIVAADPQIRARLVEVQRDWVHEHGGAVVEGRDIGTVVFPDATIKLFLTASSEERERRRGKDEHPESVARRDSIDSTRSSSPLRPAEDAHVIDTTDRTPAQIAEEVLGWM